MGAGESGEGSTGRLVDVRTERIVELVKIGRQIVDAALTSGRINYAQWRALIHGSAVDFSGPEATISVQPGEGAKRASASPGDQASDTPPIPRVNVASRFRMTPKRGGARKYLFGDPRIHGLDVWIDSAGALGFDIRADDRFGESGTDMFASLMQRLKEDGVEIKRIRGYWVPGTGSVNFQKFVKNLETMGQDEAAAKTWTGEIVRRYGVKKVDFGGIRYDKDCDCIL